MTDCSFINETMAIVVLKKVSVLILLQIFEHLMEPLFSSCPCNSYQGPFICLYFIVPAFSFTVLAISLKWGKNVLRDCKSRGCSWYKLFQFRVLIYPAVFWVVILLIDGRYLACGLYTKCNGTMTTVDMKDPEMVEKMAISKVKDSLPLQVKNSLPLQVKDSLSLQIQDRMENVTVLILLQITEHLMEHLFTCPCNEYRILFVRLFFIAPALAFAAFTFYLQQGTSFKEQVLLQPAYIASCWTVILLIDGRYLACVHYSKCNNTMTTADMTDPEMVENMTYSKGYTCDNLRKNTAVYLVKTDLQQEKLMVKEELG
ncbi:hypothetical protein JZ751_004340, partial [Albula glossodonta]